MPFAEVYTALQVGVVEAQESTLESYVDQRLFEVQPHLSLTGHVYEVVFLLTTERFLESLPEEISAAVVEAGNEIRRRSIEIAAEQEARMIEEIRDRGVDVQEVEVEQFRDYSKGSFDRFASEIPDGWEALNAVLDLAYW